jgi:CheY-like chemotaxis protein
MKLLRPALPSMITIRTETKTDDDWVMADETQLHQVLFNLGTNAAHAMYDGYGTVELIIDTVVVGDDPEATPHPELGAGRYVRLSFSDSGRGMQADELKRAFDPFFTTKSVGEGVGMGLAVVHGIVRAHGGAVTASSGDGKGSTFCIYLPRVEPATLVEPVTTEVTLPRGDERVLLVDDETLIADMGRQLLESLGYDVTVRTDSRSALATFRAAPDRFDLAILDQVMPRMTGSDLARELLTLRPNLPIIIWTAFGRGFDESDARKMGISRFLTKSTRLEDYARAVRQTLDAPAA